MAKLFDTYVVKKTTSGGGNALVRWGPDFGGLDGDRYNVGALTNFTAAQLTHERPVGVAGRFVFLDLRYNQQIVGASVSTTFNPNYNPQVVGDRVDLKALAANYNPQSIGCQHLLNKIAAAYTNNIAGQITGSVLGAPFYTSVTTAATPNLASVTTLSCPYPSGLVIGDLLIVVHASGQAGASNTPAGFTFIASNGSGSQKLGAGYRIVDGTETGNVVFTWATAGKGVMAVHRIRGTHPTTPINVSANGNANVTDPVVPSVTTTTVNCLVMYAVSHLHLLTQTHTPPASNTEVMELETADAANPLSLNTGFRIFAAAGATGTATVDCNELVASEARYLRIAIAPGPLTIA